MGRFDHIAPEADESSAAAADDGFGCQHYLDQAEGAMRRGRYESALRYYGRALEQDRQRGEAWAGQARALLEMGQELPGKGQQILPETSEHIRNKPE